MLTVSQLLDGKGRQVWSVQVDSTVFEALRMMAHKDIGALLILDGESVVVYSLGTLYGEWPDGTPFEGNRYVDRYVVRGGLITEMDVWNDSAEWLLVRAGLATA